MTKGFEIFVTNVDIDWGRPIGKTRIAICTTQKSIEEKIAAFRAEHEKGQPWMCFEVEKENKNRIKFTIEEVEIF